MSEARHAEVSKPASDEARDIFFWSHRAESLTGGEYEDLTFSTHVTKFTPNWCEAHGWAFGSRCLACEVKK